MQAARALDSLQCLVVLTAGERLDCVRECGRGGMVEKIYGSGEVRERIRKRLR